MNVPMNTIKFTNSNFTVLYSNSAKAEGGGGGGMVKSVREGGGEGVR